MAQKIYKTVNGQPVELSAKEVKNFIMKVNNWTSEQYNKERYKVKNRLRTYEAFTNAKPQSPVSFLYFEAKSRQKQGKNYKPSIERQRISSFGSYGSSKAISKALEKQKTQEKLGQQYTQATKAQFDGLLRSNAQAQKIFDSIKDPVMREKALADFANQLHLKIKESQKVQANSAIPFGETFGSEDEFEFDITPYL